MPDQATGDPVPSVIAETTKQTQVDNIRAMSWLMVSVVASSAMTIAVRMVSEELDPRMIVLLRFGITALILIAAILGIPRLRALLSFTLPGQHLVRGIFMAISTHLGFYAIAHMELVTVTVLFFMVPIFATALSGLVNAERAGPRRLAAIAVSFIGVLLILRPGYQPLNLAVFAALFSSILFASALVMSRRLGSADGTFSILVSSSALTVLISIPLALPVLELPTHGGVWIIVGVLVATGLLRLVADIQAYRFGEAAALAPITYTRLIFIGVAGYLMFGEVPDLLALLGGAIIMSAALYIVRREAMLKAKDKTIQAAALPGSKPS